MLIGLLAAVGLLGLSNRVSAQTAARANRSVAIPNMSIAAGVSSENKQQCLDACQKGIEAIEAFCRAIPDPRIRAACWGARFSLNACIGVCYWYY